MVSKLAISLLCFLVSPGNAGGTSASAAQNPAQGNASPTASAKTTSPAEVTIKAESEAGPSSRTGALDACTLIQKSEIASVQGVQVQETQSTSQKAGDLDISQCYYTVIDGSKNLSVFVQVIQRDPKSASADALKEFWEGRFGRESHESESKEKRGAALEGKRKIQPPVPVSGVGDEAFWLASNRGGALFVKKSESLIRISVGGTDDAKVSIQKSKTLAEKALARLM